MKWISAPGRLEQLYYEQTHDEKVRKKIEKKKQDRIDQILGLTPKPDPDEEDEAQSAQLKATQEGGAGNAGESPTPNAPSASGKTKSHKVEQSKTKRETPPERGHSCPPNANQRDRTEDSQPPGPLDARADRNVRAPEASSKPADVPAPEKPLTGPGITFPKRHQRLINNCFCGAKNQIPLSECDVCMRRIERNMEPCDCH